VIFQTLHLLFKCGKEYGHRRIRAGGFSDTAHLICTYIYDHEGCSQEEVTRALRLDKTTVTKALKVLLEDGRLSRVQDEKDKRKNLLALTQSGKSSVAGVIGIHDEWMNRVLQCLSGDEQQQFEACCRRLLERAEQLSQEENN